MTTLLSLNILTWQHCQLEQTGNQQEQLTTREKESTFGNAAITNHWLRSPDVSGLEVKLSGPI